MHSQLKVQDGVFQINVEIRFCRYIEYVLITVLNIMKYNQVLLNWSNE